MLETARGSVRRLQKILIVPFSAIIIIFVIINLFYYCLTPLKVMCTALIRKANTQMIHVHHKGLLHSHIPYIINHHEHLGCFMQLFNRMNTQVCVCVCV